jgi:hypothetical protein
MLLFLSKPVGIASSSNAEKTLPADLAVEEGIMFVDGELQQKGVYFIDFKRMLIKPTTNQPDLADLDTAVSVSVGMRLYFPTGLHHAVVLATSRGSADHDEPHGLLRFVSFWFEMKPNELEFFATESEHGAELRRPVASKSSHYGRDLAFVTCCSAWGALYYHTDVDSEHADYRHTLVSDGDRYHKGPLPSRDDDYRLAHDLSILERSGSYDESKCEYVWADAILIAEMKDAKHCSHYWMELLSNLFFVIESRKTEGLPEHVAFSSDHPIQYKPRISIRRNVLWSAHNSKHDASNLKLPPYHAALWPMLSDHALMEWNDVLAMVHAPTSGGGPQASPRLLCFRAFHVFMDHNMTMPYSPEMVPYWRRYRQRLWAHLRVPVEHGRVEPAEARQEVLFLRRPGTRRLLNHDEIAAMLQRSGFVVRSLTPDGLALSLVASAVVQASLLIGINSGSYNAVFLRTGCGVLELAPHAGEYFVQAASQGASLHWQVGFQYLGVHHYTYACPHLYTRDFQQVVSGSFDAAALGGTADGALGSESPIVVLPETILALLHELGQTLQQALASGSELGSVTVQGCLSEEARHSRSWVPYR